ncbi:unnamed protein product, partial [Discosporangium mesarthrocarpum]
RPESSSIPWRYSRRLLQTRTAPMSLVDGLLAENGTSELSLPHLSLGDTYIEVISGVVRGVPDVSKLNLRDNRLTDIGVQNILNSICGGIRRGVRILDLSENKLDTKSAQSLCTFLKSPTCSLTELVLSKADMDDKETTIFMEAMRHNRSVTFLDFSDNLIGGSFEKLQGSHTPSGGGAIAQALDLNTTLRRMDLQWNRLGAESGILLGHALTYNHTLEWLDVSYNAIGDRGAQAIGQALTINDGLLHLDISYNEVSAKGVLVIAQGLEANNRLRTLNIHGNSIGFDGGRTLVRSLNYWTLPRTMGLRNCTLDTHRQGDDIFSSLYPTGRYSLDCADPYQRALAYELLRIASIRPGCTIKSLVLRENERDKKGQEVNLLRPNWAVWQVDNQHRSGIRADYQILLSNHGSDNCRKRHGESSVYANMDAREYRQKLREVWVVERGTGQPYFPPDKGTLDIDITAVPMPATERALVNASGLAHLKSLIDGYKDTPLLFLSMAVKDLSFTTLQQVQDIIKTFVCRRQPLNSMQLLDLLQMFIPKIKDNEYIQGLIEMNLDIKQQRILQARIGHVFAAFTTSVCGHYCLDLGHDIEREAALRLAELSNWENMWLRVVSGWPMSSGGTSQKGKWNNFRNEKYRKQPLQRGLTDAFFKKGLLDRVPGVLEFDFVSISRPSSATEPMSRLQFERFVYDCGLGHLMEFKELKTVVVEHTFKEFHDTLTIGDAVKLKQVSGNAERLRADAHDAEVAEKEHEEAAAASPSDCNVGGKLSNENGEEEWTNARTSAKVRMRRGKGRSMVEDHRNITSANRVGSAGEAGTEVNPRMARAKRRSLAAKLARQRLRKAATFACYGLAGSKPFVVKPSLGEGSLAGFLGSCNVKWSR